MHDDRSLIIVTDQQVNVEFSFRTYILILYITWKGSEVFPATPHGDLYEALSRMDMKVFEVKRGYSDFC